MTLFSHPRAIILHHFHAMMLSKVIIFKQAIIILPFLSILQAFIIFYSRMEIILTYSIAHRPTDIFIILKEIENFITWKKKIDDVTL